jgi:hypothetical protein
MKKLILIGAITFLAFGCSSAQHHRQGDYSPRESREYAHKDWGYDNNYRVARSSNVRRIESFQRQAYMKIENGRKRGTISRNGYNRLMRAFDQIENKENRFMRNGRLTNEQTRILHRDLANLDKMIQQETRGSRRGRF